MTKLRKIDIDRDLPILNSWLTERKWSLASRELLPQTGYMAYDTLTGASLGACFLYETNSAIALMGWPIINPGSGHNSEEYIYGLLVGAITDIAQLKGFKAVISMAAPGGAQEKLKKAGFIESEKGLTQLVLQF